MQSNGCIGACQDTKFMVGVVNTVTSEWLAIEGCTLFSGTHFTQQLHFDVHQPRGGILNGDIVNAFINKPVNYIFNSVEHNLTLTRVTCCIMPGCSIVCLSIKQCAFKKKKRSIPCNILVSFC